MTRQEIIDLPREYLTPDQAASVLGQDANLIRVAARDHPEKLPYPVVRVGSRTKIPKAAFMRFMGWIP